MLSSLSFKEGPEVTRVVGAQALDPVLYPTRVSTSRLSGHEVQNPTLNDPAVEVRFDGSSRSGNIEFSDLPNKAINEARWNIVTISIQKAKAHFRSLSIANNSRKFSHDRHYTGPEIT